MELELIENLSITNSNYNKLTAEYFVTFGSKIESQNNNTLLINNGTSVIDGWNTAYGKKDIIPKTNHQYCWVFVIRQHHKNSNYGAIAIGIEALQKRHNHKETCFHQQTATKHYAFTSDGKRYSHLHSNGIRFSDKFNERDSMVMMLIDGYTLSFCKVSAPFIQRNNIHSIEDYIQNGAWIIAEKKIIKDVKYRMAVSLYGKTKIFGNKECDMSSVELLKYAWISNENDEIDSLLKEIDNSSDDEDEDDNVEVDNTLKDAILSLEQQMSDFEGKFDIDELSVGPVKNGKYLDVMADINTLENRLESFNKHIVNMKNYISSVLDPDITEYETWDITQMLQWISSLDNGEYVKYLKVLKKGFKSDSIISGNMLCELTSNDLRNEPFNIKSFPVRQKLVQYFQILKRGNMPYNSYADHDQYKENDNHSIGYNI